MARSLRHTARDLDQPLRMWPKSGRVNLWMSANISAQHPIAVFH
jgi:hypothetical protein